MRNDPSHPEEAMERETERVRDRMPRPTPQFRRRSWVEFQRAIDPLAPPKPVRSRGEKR